MGFVKKKLYLDWICILPTATNIKILFSSVSPINLIVYEINAGDL